MEPAAQTWQEDRPPKRILAIRLQAMGDVVISLPYLLNLRRSLPEGTQLDFLTCAESAGIPSNVVLFDHVYRLGGGRRYKLQLLSAGVLLPALLLRRYDVVLDLQNNQLSRMLRRALRPRAWSAFDRFSPKPAGERNRCSIEAAGLGACIADTDFVVRTSADAERLLLHSGWTPDRPLVVLNPAGAFENRHWPVAYFVDFARRWLRVYPDTCFLLMGLPKIEATAKALDLALGKHLINLVGRTSQELAFGILQRAQFVLSEDSGLMHMAWVSGIPTLALFGSTRSDWAQPLGPHADFFDSSDLDCGNCMLEHCRHTGEMENHCMKRLSPEVVLGRALRLVDSRMAT
jgi:heptosyltransferase-2